VIKFIDFKFIIAIIATLLVIIGYIPYFKDIFARKTKPHLYTWLIWAITQGTATVALLYGGGKFGGMSLIVGTILLLFVVILSFKYGTKDIKISDKIILILALFAIVFWWQLDNPLIAVLIVSAINGVGFIPTIRKSFLNPWGETLSFWGIMIIVDFLALISNAEYNFLTVFYLFILLIGNMLVFSICFFRRKNIKVIKE